MTSQRALEQMRNLALQNAIDAYPDGIVISSRFQRFIELRNGEGGIPPKKTLKVILRISLNDRLQDRFPVIGAVHIAGTQSASFKMTKLIENEQGVVAHAVEVPVPSGALLCAMGRADQTVHVQRDPLWRLALIKPVDPLSR